MTQIAKFVGMIIGVIDGVIVPLVFAVAFIVFIIGVFQYFIAGGADDEKRKLGKQFVMYSLIGFVLMLSLWGIVNLLVGSLGFGAQARPGLPTFGGGANGGSQQGGFFNGAQNVPTTGKVPVGGSCTGAAQCADPGICVINGNTGEGTCRAI